MTKEEDNPCERCGGTGTIEITGDGANGEFEVDVIGYKKCPDCGEEE